MGTIFTSNVDSITISIPGCDFGSEEHLHFVGIGNPLVFWKLGLAIQSISMLSRPNLKGVCSAK
jgi:hypothetical protein